MWVIRHFFSRFQLREFITLVRKIVCSSMTLPEIFGIMYNRVICGEFLFEFVQSMDDWKAIYGIGWLELDLELELDYNWGFGFLLSKGAMVIELTGTMQVFTRPALCSEPGLAPFQFYSMLTSLNFCSFCLFPLIILTNFPSSTFPCIPQFSKPSFTSLPGRKTNKIHSFRCQDVKCRKILQYRK